MADPALIKSLLEQSQGLRDFMQSPDNEASVIRGMARQPGRSWADFGPSIIRDGQMQSWYDGQGEDAELHGRFVAEVDDALHRPLIRAVVGDELQTPADYMLDVLESDPDLKALGNDELKQEIMLNARASIAGLPGTDNRYGITPQSKIVQGIVDQTIGAMRSSSTDGEDAEFAPATQSQYAQWEQESGPMEARYRVTDAGQRNLDRLRAANLFRTFQSGDNAPEWANAAGTALGAVGGAAAALERGFRLDPEKSMDTLDVMMLGGRSPVATPAGRLRESMYWHDQGKKNPSQDASFKDSWSGAKFPQFSSTTLAGVGKNLTSNENYSSAINQPFRTFFQQPLETTPSDRSLLNTASFDLLRTTPVISDGGNVRLAKQMRDSLEGRASQNEGWLSAQWPRAANAVNAAAGTQVVPPQYLSQAADIAGNMPRWYAEDPSALVLGGKGAMAVGRGLATRSPRAALGSVGAFASEAGKDFLKELPQEMGAEVAVNPNPSNPFEAQASNTWMGTRVNVDDVRHPFVEPFPASSPADEYEQRYQDVFRQRAKALSDIRSNAPYVLPK